MGSFLDRVDFLGKGCKTVPVQVQIPVAPKRAQSLTFAASALLADLREVTELTIETNEMIQTTEGFGVESVPLSRIG